MRKIILFSLVLLSLALSVTVFCLNRVYKSNIVKIERKVFNIKEENDNFKKVIGLMYQYDGKKLPDKICSDENGNKKLFSEFCALYSNILVFNYSMSDCSSCIDQVIQKLSSKKNDYVLFIVSNFENTSSMRYMKNKHGLNNAVFLKIESDIVLSQLDSDTVFFELGNDTGFPETPSLFLIDNKLIIRKFLIINQNDVILVPYLKQL